ncbi:MAG: hypothetical protein BVN30_08600, partial [Proteobacteria bacterium ST_bin16]
PAIWLKDDNQFEQARVLLDAYQNERTVRMRAEYARLEQEGKNRTFFDEVKEKPVSFAIHLALAWLVIYLSIQLVLDLAR